MYFISIGLPDDVARLVVDLENDFVASMVVRAMRRCYMDKKGRVGSMHRAATELLEEMLGEGSVDTELIYEMALSRGVSIPVLNKAKKRMGVKSFKVGYGHGAAWHWGLPEEHEIIKGNRDLREISGIRVISYKSPIKRNAGQDEDKIQAEAQQYLKDMLKDGPKSSKDLVEIGRLTGVSQTSIKKAKKSLNIISVKRGFSAGWDWKLP